MTYPTESTFVGCWCDMHVLLSCAPMLGRALPARKLMMLSLSRPASRRGSVVGNQEGVQAASGHAKENSCWGLHTMMPLLLHGSQPPSAAGLSCSAARVHMCTASFQLRFLKVHTGNSSCAPDISISCTAVWGYSCRTKPSHKAVGFHQTCTDK